MESKILKSFIPTIPYPEISLAKYLLDKFQQFDDQKVVLIDCPTGRRHTAKQVYDRVLNISAAFIKLGLKKGDVVCFVCPNSDYYAIGLLGVIAAGGVFTACSDHCPYREVHNAVEDTDAKYIVSSANNLMVSKKVAKNLQQIRKIIVISDEIVVEKEEISFSHLWNYNKSNCDYELPKRVDCEKDIAALLLSSGSTGRPKPIIRTHKNALNLTIQFQHKELWGLSEESIHSCQNTFCHSGGFTFLIHSLASGAIAAVMPGFDGQKFIEYVEKYKITNAFLVPSYVIYLANSDVSNKDVSSFKDVVCAGSPLPSGIAEKIIKNLNLNYFRQGYGMTEVGFCTQVWRSKTIEHLHCVGWCVPDSQVKIVDPKSGLIQGPHQIGEVLIKNFQKTPGYLNRPEINAELFDSEDFLRSGDAGYYDEEDLLYIVDRYKHIMKVEGVIVLPAELESLLLNHEDVSEAAVIAVKHGFYGEIPKAFVVLKENRNVSEETLIKYIDELVAVHKRLRGGLNILKEMPKTPLGKINKTLLK